jgi:hypothetical protein
MRPVTLVVTGSPAASGVYAVDTHREGGIALGVVISGTITYTVQHTFDDVFATAFDPATATWFNHPTLAGDSANEDSNYAYLPRGIRITTSAGTGSASLTIVQMGMPGG